MPAVTEFAGMYTLTQDVTSFYLDEGGLSIRKFYRSTKAVQIAFSTAENPVTKSCTKATGGIGTAVGYGKHSPFIVSLLLPTHSVTRILHSNC